MTKNLLRIVQRESTLLIGLYMALTCILWGAILLIPGTTLRAGSVFAVMALIACDDVWGAVFIALGLMELYALGKGSVRLRRLGSFVLLILWVFLFVAGTLSLYPPAPAVGTYLLNALFCALIYLRLGGHGE